MDRIYDYYLMFWWKSEKCDYQFQKARFFQGSKTPSTAIQLVLEQWPKQDEYYIAQVEKIPFNKRDAMLQQIMWQFTLTELLHEIHKMAQMIYRLLKMKLHKLHGPVSM